MHLVFPVEGLEVRQRGGGRSIRGLFRYGSRATISDRGRTRKEQFESRAFRYAIEDPEREINLLRGHNFDQTLASRRAGSLHLEDTDEALEFFADIPGDELQTTAWRDILRELELGLVGGISPGFRVPPRDVVPGAERLEPEPGNPGVMIRVIRAAVLHELSLVTRPAYPATEVDVRSMHDVADVHRRPRVWL